MSLSHKTPSVQAYRLLVYQRALHPELFRIQGRASVQQADYELESWVLPGGHILRFQGAGKCLSEAVVDDDQHLPQRGLFQSVQCLGEKELEEDVDETVRYLSSVQTESLSENLYNATYNEMIDFARDSDALSYRWEGREGGQNLSIVDVQRYRGQVHAQSYHLLSTLGFVLRTQTIFELR